MNLNVLENDLKPREKLLKYGAVALTDEELIAIILHTGTKEQNVFSLAKQINTLINSLNNYQNLSLNTLLNLKGIGLVKAVSLLASIEYGRRTTKNIKETNEIINAKSVYELFKLEYQFLAQEKFSCIFLNTKRKIITIKTIFIGTINQSIIHPREIFKEALLVSASSIILVHNHPSGDVTPSLMDIKTTNQLQEIGKILLIPVIDHVIIGNNKYYSFKEQGKV